MNVLLQILLIIYIIVIIYIIKYPKKFFRFQRKHMYKHMYKNDIEPTDFLVDSIKIKCIVFLIIDIILLIVSFLQQ